jgi:hypothetical protein
VAATKHPRGGGKGARAQIAQRRNLGHYFDSTFFELWQGLGYGRNLRPRENRPRLHIYVAHPRSRDCCRRKRRCRTARGVRPRFIQLTWICAPVGYLYCSSVTCSIQSTTLPSSFS